MNYQLPCSIANLAKCDFTRGYPPVLHFHSRCPIITMKITQPFFGLPHRRRSPSVSTTGEQRTWAGLLGVAVAALPRQAPGEKRVVDLGFWGEVEEKCCCKWSSIVDLIENFTSILLIVVNEDNQYMYIYIYTHKRIYGLIYIYMYKFGSRVLTRLCTCILHRESRTYNHHGH